MRRVSFYCANITVTVGNNDVTKQHKSLSHSKIDFLVYVAGGIFNYNVMCTSVIYIIRLKMISITKLTPDTVSSQRKRIFLKKSFDKKVMMSKDVKGQNTTCPDFSTVQSESSSR